MQDYIEELLEDIYRLDELDDPCCVADELSDK
jgi:hypothetical protein